MVHEEISDEVAYWRRTRDSQSQIALGELKGDDKVDYRLIDGLAAFHLRLYDERQEHLWNIRASLYPYSILQYQIPQLRTFDDWERLTERIAAVPRFLREQERNLRMGIEASLVPPRLHIERIVGAIAQLVASFFDATRLASIGGNLITPSLRTFLERSVSDARQAYEAQATFLSSVVLPKSKESFALGRTEYRWRLQHVLGAPLEPEEIVEQGHSVLAEIQQEMVKQAHALDAGVRNFADALALLAKKRERHPASNEEVLELYRVLTKRAQTFVTERQLFVIPGDLNLRIIQTPPGMAVSIAANWPAPLLDPSQDGHFLVTLDDGPAAHTNIDAAPIAVHEGVPGHYLQSFVWQQHYSGSDVPIRFLLVADDVNVMRNHWGTNMNIEGYALYVEHLMLQQGFYEVEESLAALAAQAVRAARMIVDPQLHLGRMTVDAAVEFLQRETGAHKNDAKREAIRYTEMPLQAITYMLGCRQIEKLKSDYRRLLREAFEEQKFHERFFSYGPIQPSLIQDAMLRQ